MQIIRQELVLILAVIVYAMTILTYCTPVFALQSGDTTIIIAAGGVIAVHH
jgi:hypothetical protein